jgi:hypothetical protein
MRVLILTSMLAAGAVSSVHAGADVQVKEGLVSIRAAGTPLADVLERLQEQTGMKVIYDGPRPQQAVGIAIEDQTLTAAISTLLDPQGIKYAIALNSAGTQVATLLITTSTPPRPPARPDTPAAPAPLPAEDSSYTMPPMPAPMPGMEAPPMTMSVTTPPPTNMAPMVSPFTPQGPGPVLLPPPTMPASGSATVPGSAMGPGAGVPPGVPTGATPVMTPLPGPSTAERPPWEK